MYIKYKEETLMSIAIFTNTILGIVALIAIIIVGLIVCWKVLALVWALLCDCAGIVFGIGLVAVACCIIWLVI